MRAPELAFLALTSACIPELDPKEDANGPVIGESCTTVGVANVESEEDTGTITADELLAQYGDAPFAARLTLTLQDDAHYISGEVTSLHDEKGIFTCMSDEAGSCEVDVYNNCPDTETAWTADFNTAPQAIACSYVGKEGEPDCNLDGTELSIEVGE